MGAGGWGTKRRLVPVAERFWRHVDKRGPDECWPWTGSIGGNGYGQLGSFQETKTHVCYKAHRLSYELHHGPIQAGMHVLHECDNKVCCNPAHLHLGTHQDNMREAAERGRHLRGEQQPNAVLTEAQVLEARRLARAGTPLRVISKQIGAKTMTVSQCVSGRSWGHVPGALGKRTAAKVDDDDVREILRLRAEGLRLKQIGAFFGITESQVCRICKGNRRAA